MANKCEYVLEKKFTQGTEGTGFLLRNINTGDGKVYSKIQVIYLVGKGQVKNVEAQLYKDKVLLRGKEVNLNELQTEKKTLEEAASIDKAELNKKILQISASIKRGRKCVGYMVLNTMTGEQKPFAKDKVIKMCLNKQIINASVQRDNTHDTYLIRGVECMLSSLPVFDADTMQRIK